MPREDEALGSGGNAKVLAAIVNASEMLESVALDTQSRKGRPGASASTSSKAGASTASTTKRPTLKPTRAGTRINKPKRTATLTQRRMLADDWLNAFGRTKFNSANYPFARWTYSGGHLVVKTSRATPSSHLGKGHGESFGREILEGFDAFLSGLKHSSSTVANVSSQVQAGLTVAGLSTLEVPGIAEAFLATAELAGLVHVAADGVIVLTHPTRQDEEQLAIDAATAGTDSIAVDVGASKLKLNKFQKKVVQAVLDVLTSEGMSGVGR